MRINDSYGRFNNPAVETARQGAGTAAKPKADDGGAVNTPAPGGEKVTVSAQAQEMAQKAASDADAAKVNGLRAAIQNGTFKVDHQAIARRIVDGG
jgi:negative regulator of flagellin synthesis FlgM